MKTGDPRTPWPAGLAKYKNLGFTERPLSKEEWEAIAKDAPASISLCVHNHTSTHTPKKAKKCGRKLHHISGSRKSTNSFESLCLTSDIREKQVTLNLLCLAFIVFLFFIFCFFITKRLNGWQYKAGLATDTNSSNSSKHERQLLQITDSPVCTK